MTKKNSSKMPVKNSHEGPSSKNQKPSLKLKKMGSKIDKKLHDVPSSENQKPSLKPKKMGSKIDKNSHVVPSSENQKTSLKPKKMGSKIDKNSHEVPSSENQKTSLKPKKMGSEIDEIFAAKKRKMPGNDEKPDKVSSSAKVKLNGKMRTVRDDGKKSKNLNEYERVEKSRTLDEYERVELASRSRQKTADGLTLYTEEELGFGKSNAGGTPLCPFDCDCCF